ncbi:MAG TPA: SCO family protein [Gemmataceae bacterium]|nr:SCO family protein [Gemmataceae bacterium]
MRWGTLLCGLLLVLNAEAAHADETQAPPILREVELRQKLDAQTPLDAAFRDEHGQTVTLGDCMAGKTTILVLAYYRCPKVCSQLLNDLTLGLRGVPLTLGDDYRVVTVSIDDRETPELAAAKKQSYIDKYGLPGMEKGWHFLTGSQQSILRLANAVGYQFRWDPKNDLFAHPTCIMILTPDGKVSRYLLRLRDPDRSGDFSRDLRLGLVEASEHKIGTKTDSILLFCYRYDPETGKYTMTALNLVRAAGAITVLLLGSALLVMWRREWRKVSRDPKGSASDALPFGSRLNDRMGMS